MDHDDRIAKTAPEGNAGWLEAVALQGVPGLVHGFSLRSLGDAAAGGFGVSLCGRTGAQNLRLLEQVHGAEVAAAADPVPLPRADAWAGRPAPGTLLGIRTADCLPILLCHPGTRTLGLAHAGWRGAVAGVIPAVLKAMGVPADEILAALGPSIRPCCYQVAGEVVRAVGEGSGHLEPWPGAPGRYRFDLAGLVVEQLRSAGVGRLSHLDRCTSCEPELFFSYRREGRTGRMVAFAGWA